jgi:hypothetical protein
LTMSFCAVEIGAWTSTKNTTCQNGSDSRIISRICWNRVGAPVSPCGTIRNVRQACRSLPTSTHGTRSYSRHRRSMT